MRTVVADVTTTLPDTDRTYDLVVVGGMLEHVDLPATVLLLSGRLRPGGWFLDAAVRDNWAGRVAGAFWRFDPHSREAIVGAFHHGAPPCPT